MTAAPHEKSRPAGGGGEVACARSSDADTTTTAPAVEKRESWFISDSAVASWVIHPGTGFADRVKACLEALPLLQRIQALFPEHLCLLYRERPDLIPPACQPHLVQLWRHLYGTTAAVVRLLHAYTDIPNNLPSFENDK